MAVRRQASEQPQCGAGEYDDYDVGLQVFGLFLILLLSALSCSFPLAVKRFSWVPVPRRLLFICRHLGTGVIIATSFVHLVPTAFENLHDPCLPKFWTEDFPAMPGLIIMLGALVVSGIEMFFASRKIGHTHQSDFTDPSHTPENSHSHSPPDGQTCDGGADDLEQQHSASEKSPNNERLLLQCALLEGGILFHSIFIGMAIAFSTGTAFVVLLIAISFHQIFEGLALGSRIAGIDFGPKSPKPWLMALAYGVTAPLGQAVGLAVHGTFDLESRAGLLMVGVANAFSRYVIVSAADAPSGSPPDVETATDILLSGLLIYAGLVQLFYEDFLSEQSQRTLKGRRRVEACISFLVGAVGMSIIGAWA